MKKFYLLASAVAAISMISPADAAIVWSWSFAGEQGTFTTDGSAPGNVAAAGTYNFTDFSVTGSALGRQQGSVGGGQYVAAGFSTITPYSFSWDGSAVTLWDSAGVNSFNWWVFQNVASPNQFHFFGYDTGNVNNPASAALFSLNSGEQAVGSVRVSVNSTGAVPEPASWALMIAGFGLVGSAMRRRKPLVSVSFA